MPQRILALEIEPHELKAAVLETSFRDYRVIGFYREPLAQTEAPLSDQIRSFVEKHRLDGSTVLSSLPGEMVTLRTFFLPFRDRKRLDQTVPFEIETQVPFDLDDVVIAYQVLNRDKAGSNVLAALVHRKDLEQHLATLGAAGLDPKVVDFAPLAMLNVLALVGSGLPDTFAYVGGSLQRTTVALYRNRKLVGLRTLIPSVPASGHEEVEAAGNGHSPRHDAVLDELVRDIRWSLLAINGAPIDDQLPCLVGGEDFPQDEIAQRLAHAGLSVQQIEQSPMKSLPADLRRQMAPFAAPLGLALREVTEQSVGINFRQGEFAYHRGQQEVRRALWGTGAIAVVAVLLFLTNTYMQHRQLQSRLAAVNAQIRSVFHQTLPDVTRVVDERMQLQEEITLAERRLKLLGSVAPPSGATAVDAMHAVSTAVPDSLKVEVDEYVMDTEDIKIKAKTDSLETPNAIREAIANSKYFADVQVKDIKTGQDGRVDFRVILSLSKKPTEKTAAGRP
jgi:general secretion pathway protein L